METLELTAGVVIVVLILYDVFQSIVVPRWTSRRLRLTPWMTRQLWLMWRRIAFRMSDRRRQDDFLAAYGPLIVLLTLIYWTAGLILGYGLALHALGDAIRPPVTSLGTAVYLAGTCLFTIGFGDLVAVGPASRAIGLVAGATGLAIVGMVFSLLFSLHAAFQTREAMVIQLETRGGSPPSGLAVLETYARLDMKEDLPHLFRAWEHWTAQVLESHLAYPPLLFFRSSHESDSWVSALGAVLDAATLVLTTVEDIPRGSAQLMHDLGVHAVSDISRNLPRPPGVATDIQPWEYDEARRRLSAAGYQLADAAEAWDRFRNVRESYALGISIMARVLEAPPTLWIGDRSSIRHLHKGAG